jgi:hypothetical protein
MPWHEHSTAQTARLLLGEISSPERLLFQRGGGGGVYSSSAQRTVELHGKFTPPKTKEPSSRQEIKQKHRKTAPKRGMRQRRARR